MTGVTELPVVLLLGASAERDKIVRAALRDVATVRGERTLAAALTGGGVRLALVDLVGDVAAGLRAIEELQRAAHAVPVIALAATKDPELILQAMRAGAREFVVPADAGELARVVEQLARKLGREGATGQVISLFSAKGGLGATTLAANLAGTQDVPAVKNAQRCLDVMRRLGYGDDKLQLVINRHQKSEIDLQSVADTLGVPVHAAIANDYPTVSKAINRGVLLRDVAPRA